MPCVLEVARRLCSLPSPNYQLSISYPPERLCSPASLFLRLFEYLCADLHQMEMCRALLNIWCISTHWRVIQSCCFVLVPSHREHLLALFTQRVLLLHLMLLVKCGQVLRATSAGRAARLACICIKVGHFRLWSLQCVFTFTERRQWHVKTNSFAWRCLHWCFESIHVFSLVGVSQVSFVLWLVQSQYRPGFQDRLRWGGHRTSGH